MATPPPSKKAKYQCWLGMWPLPVFHFRKLATMSISLKQHPIWEHEHPKALLTAKILQRLQQWKILNLIRYDYTGLQSPLMNTISLLKENIIACAALRDEEVEVVRNL